MMWKYAAEIRELIALKKEADSEKKPQASVSKPEHKKNQAEQDAPEKYDEPEEPVATGADVYKEYIGKRIYHTGKKMYGIVKTCDDKYLGIAFESGPDAGVVKNFSLQMCISNGLIRIV